MFQVATGHKGGAAGKRPRAEAKPLQNKHDRIVDCEKNMKLIRLQLSADHLLAVNGNINKTLEIATQMEKADWSISMFLSGLNKNTLERIYEIEFVGSKTEEHLKKVCKIMVFERLGIATSKEQIELLEELVENNFLLHYTKTYFDKGNFQNVSFRAIVAAAIAAAKE